MRKAQFLKNFPRGVEPPLALLKLLEYQNSVRDFYSGHFELTGDGQKETLASFDGDEQAAAQFILFGRDSDGSSYGYWLHGGRALDKAPIVFLGSEGGGTVLANTLEEFLALLVVGQDELGFNVLSGFEIEEPEDPSEELLAFRVWLQEELGIKKPRDPNAVVARAKKRHPDLDAWCDAWAESRG